MNAPSVTTSLPYRTAARRIRARLAHQPLRMHRALAHLAAESAPATSPPIAPLSPLPDGVRTFTQIAADAIDGPILRYSSRQRLIRQADSLGIHRFEANLIIATLQHQRRNHVAVTDDRDAASRPSRRWLLAILLQILIGIAVLWLWI